MDSIGHYDSMMSICVCRMTTFFHKFYHTVDNCHRSTEKSNNTKTTSSNLHDLRAQNRLLTFRLHACLLQSRSCLHLASHKYCLLHGNSLVYRPQRHFFSTISKHWPHSPRWHRSAQMWLPHFKVFWQVFPHGSISTVHGAWVVWKRVHWYES